jgi:hypothetical protein
MILEFGIAGPPKSPDPAALSCKRGRKSLVLRLCRNPPGTPRLWPHLAEIAMLAKTAFSP